MTSPNAFLSAALLAASAATATAAVSGRVDLRRQARRRGHGIRLCRRGARGAGGTAGRGPGAARAGLGQGLRRRHVPARPRRAAGGDWRARGRIRARLCHRLAGRGDGGARSPRPSLRRGVVTALGRPVAAATLAWLADADDPQSAEAIVRTGADGSYEVPDPDRWATHLAVFHPDFALLVATPSPKWAGDPRARRGHEGGGPGDRADRSGHGVAGATIWLDGWPRARSGAGGTFTVASRRGGLEPHVRRARRRWRGRGRRGRAASSSPSSPRGGSSGVVRDAATRQPLAGAAIRVLEGDDRGPAGAAVTDARGQYSISGLPPGRYWPYATRPGYAPGGPGQESMDVRQAAAADPRLRARPAPPRPPAACWTSRAGRWKARS